jgi:EAL domain-containing protein (putative c-di-GMP-specific phosphodiesterase class I)
MKAKDMQALLQLATTMKMKTMAEAIELFKTLQAIKAHKIG